MKTSFLFLPPSSWPIGKNVSYYCTVIGHFLTIPDLWTEQEIGNVTPRIKPLNCEKVCLLYCLDWAIAYYLRERKNTKNPKPSNKNRMKIATYFPVFLQLWIAKRACNVLKRNSIIFLLGACLPLFWKIIPSLDSNKLAPSWFIDIQHIHSVYNKKIYICLVCWWNSSFSSPLEEED